MSLRLISLHQLPAGAEARPEMHKGSHAECHKRESAAAHHAPASQAGARNLA